VPWAALYARGVSGFHTPRVRWTHPVRRVRHDASAAPKKKEGDVRHCRGEPTLSTGGKDQGSSSIPLRGRRILCRPGPAPDPSLRHDARWRRSGGSERGWDVAGGHPHFSRQALMPIGAPRSQPSPIPAARSRGLPDRTEGGADAGSGGRTGAHSGTTARQAPAKDARQVEVPAGCSACTAGKVSAEDSAILTVAEACDGTTAGLATRRTRGVACNQLS
jgi:ribosomal protein L37AE/L43A